jgi:hypothetical protein
MYTLLKISSSGINVSTNTSHLPPLGSLCPRNCSSELVLRLGGCQKITIVGEVNKSFDRKVILPSSGLNKQNRPKVTWKFVRFEVFTAVTMTNGVFWDVMPRGSCKNRRFGVT